MRSAAVEEGEMIITCGMILKKELQIKLSDLFDIEYRVIRGQKVRLTGLDGDIVFLTPEETQPEYVIEVEQQT